MGKFIAGILCTILVHLLGWDTIETALSRASDATRAAYTSVEAQATHLRTERGDK
jgi:hypothetical protein